MPAAYLCSPCKYIKPKTLHSICLAPSRSEGGTGNRIGTNWGVRDCLQPETPALCSFLPPLIPTCSPSAGPVVPPVSRLGSALVSPAHRQHLPASPQHLPGHCWHSAPDPRSAAWWQSGLAGCCHCPRSISLGGAVTEGWSPLWADLSHTVRGCLWPSDPEQARLNGRSVVCC